MIPSTITALPRIRWPWAGTPDPGRQGFTLIELLVVVAIIAVLAGLLVPAIAIVRANSQSSACKSTIRQFGLAMTAYGQDNDGFYPIDTNRFYPTNGWAQRYWQTDASYVAYLEVTVAPLMGTPQLAKWYRLVRDPANKDFSTSGLATVITGTTSAKYSDYVANRYIVGRNLATASFPYSSMNSHNLARVGSTLLLSDSGNSKLVTGGSYFTDVGDTTLGSALFRHPNRTANMIMADLHVEGLTSTTVPASAGIDTTDSADPGRLFWSKYP